MVKTAPPSGFFESLDISGLIASQGLFLILGGAWGAITTGALHSLFMGCVCGLPVLACAFMASFSSDRKMVLSAYRMDIFLTSVVCAVFCWQTAKAYGDSSKADRFPLFVILVVGSLCHVVAMLRMKPKRPD